MVYLLTTGSSKVSISLSFLFSFFCFSYHCLIFFVYISGSFLSYMVWHDPYQPIDSHVMWKMDTLDQDPGYQTTSPKKGIKSAHDIIDVLKQYKYQASPLLLQLASPPLPAWQQQPREKASQYRCRSLSNPLLSRYGVKFRRYRDRWWGSKCSTRSLGARNNVTFQVDTSKECINNLLNKCIWTYNIQEYYC